MTTKQIIMNRLLQAHPRKLAIHEMNVLSSAQTAQSMRLRELSGEQLVTVVD